MSVAFPMLAVATADRRITIFDLDRLRTQNMFQPVYVLLFLTPNLGNGIVVEVQYEIHCCTQQWLGSRLHRRTMRSEDNRIFQHRIQHPKQRQKLHLQSS